jgi:hypothetical protein
LSFFLWLLFLCMGKLCHFVFTLSFYFYFVFFYFVFVLGFRVVSERTRTRRSRVRVRERTKDTWCDGESTPDQVSSYIDSSVLIRAEIKPLPPSSHWLGAY